MRLLLTSADVFIHNIRADAIQRLGLGYDAVKDLQPHIIYVHCTGFGSDGPYAGLQAYDDVIQAASGTATLASRVDGNSKPRYIPSLIADKVAGLHGAYATMAAIIHRLRTGEGQFVEIPMFESFTNFMLKEHLAGQTFDPPTGPVCYFRQIDPDRQPFPTKDGYISVVPYTDDSWAKVFDVLGDSLTLKQEKFSSTRGRAKNLGELYRTVGKLTAQKTTEELTVSFAEASIPAMPVRYIGDIRNDPHLETINFFTRREHPTEGAFFEMKAPVHFGAWSCPSLSPAPKIGEHSTELRQISDMETRRQ